MVRYPHILEIDWTTGTTFDDHGFPQPGSAISEEVEGRGEANGKGNLIRTEDGMQIVYDWVFFSTRKDFRAPLGATAKILEDGTAIWEGTVKRQANNQKGTQIWL